MGKGGREERLFPEIISVTLSIFSFAEETWLQTFRTVFREFPGCPVIRIWCFHCWGPSSMPGQGTEIPQEAQTAKNKNLIDLYRYFNSSFIGK